VQAQAELYLTVVVGWLYLTYIEELFIRSRQKYTHLFVKSQTKMFYYKHFLRKRCDLKKYPIVRRKIKNSCLTCPPYGAMQLAVSLSAAVRL
jgi:hypothetical protein